MSIVEQPGPRKKSDGDLPKDSKLLTEQIINLQKQVQDKDDALRDLNQKLAHKTEECNDLEEERNIVRRRTSIDLQKVFKIIRMFWTPVTVF